MVRRYLKVPVSVFAIQFDGQNFDSVKEFALTVYPADKTSVHLVPSTRTKNRAPAIEIEAPQCTNYMERGDWLVHYGGKMLDSVSDYEFGRRFSADDSDKRIVCHACGDVRVIDQREVFDWDFRGSPVVVFCGKCSARQRATLRAVYEIQLSSAPEDTKTGFEILQEA